MSDSNKINQELTVMEAVDHLSSLAELDLKTPQSIDESKINWLDPQNTEEKRETIKQMFRVINNYLHHLYEKDKGRLKDVETQRGVQSIMVLVGEAAQKLDKYTSFFKGANTKNSVTYLKEYQDLQQYYLTKIIKRFQKSLETEEAWQAEWGGLEEEHLDIQRRGLKDLETVRRDKEYELFYIRRDDGRPFFNRNLLRHIKLVGDFDETLSDPTGEDPFLKIKLIQDRQMHINAREILNNAAPYIDPFYKEAMRHKEEILVASLNKALMALMLSSNPQNLLQNTSGKSSLSFFHDFQVYLRKALASDEYKKLIATPFDELDKFSHCLLNLSSALCTLLFTRPGEDKETVGLIKKLIEKGRKTKATPEKGVYFWDMLLDEDEQIRYLLKHYPNGPLLKTLDAFREGEEDEGFDPLMQENLPSHLFSVNFEQLEISCLKLPCPTRQFLINKADLVDEFASFVRSVNTKTVTNKHLLINLQDRTSWQEHIRSIILEDMHRKAEFSENLIVITLPKNTDFYLQSETYHDLSETDQFIEQIKEQISSAEECGFYFPHSLKTKEFSSFINGAVQIIHTYYFDKKTTLTRKERLDFIEIFYQFIILKCIDHFQPNSLSLTCKDAIDTGAAASASLFSFLKTLSQDPSWSEIDKDRLLFLIYSPALFIRERAIDPQRLHRMISMMATVQAHTEMHREAILSSLQDFYKNIRFAHLKIT